MSASHVRTDAPAGSAPPLADTVALVTGASSGMAAACAVALAREGARVALVARRKSRLDAIAATIREHGGAALVLEADLADRSQAARKQLPVRSQVSAGSTRSSTTLGSCCSGRRSTATWRIGTRWSR